MGNALPTGDHLRTADPLSAEWVTVLLLVVLTLMALVQLGAPRKWRSLGRSMFSIRLGRQALREEMGLRDRSFLGLLLLGGALLALFTWQAMRLNGWGGTYLVPLGVVVALVMGHFVLLRALGAMLRIDAGMQEYTYTGLLVFIMAGLALLPLVVGIAYRPTWRTGALLAGGIVLGVLLVYRWLRGVWIGLGEGIPLRYIIIYFCAAELMPVLLAVHTWRGPSTE